MAGAGPRSGAPGSHTPAAPQPRPRSATARLWGSVTVWQAQPVQAKLQGPYRPSQALDQMPPCSTWPTASPFQATSGCDRKVWPEAAGSPGGTR